LHAAEQVRVGRAKQGERRTDRKQAQESQEHPRRAHVAGRPEPQSCDSAETEQEIICALIDE
jgi:hypothetical protein